MFDFSHLVACSHAIVSWYIKVQLIVIFIDITVSFLDSPRLRFYGCYLAYCLTCSTVAFTYIPILALKFSDPANILLSTPPMVMLARLLGVEWELRGAQYITKDEAGVITMNHQSIFDVMGLCWIGTTIQRAWVVAKKELFYYWPFGLSIWLGGVIFIDRNKGKEANKRLMSSLSKVKEQRTKLLMFPEGTRNKNPEELLPFKKGAFRLAIEGQMPIIPVVLSPYYFIDSKNKMFYKGKMIMSALPPIPTKGKTMEDLDMLLEKTQAVMQEEYHKLKIEIEESHVLIKTS